MENNEILKRVQDDKRQDKIEKELRHLIQIRDRIYERLRIMNGNSQGNNFMMAYANGGNNNVERK